jgi:3-hydroxyisobutyrate dehydrogenase-like beta-hydroxyacid dehydrogenase
LGAVAAALYREFVDQGHGELDYSAIIRIIRED